MIAVTLTDWEGTMVYHTAVTFPRQTECPGSVAHGSDRCVSLSWESSVVPGGAVDQTAQWYLGVHRIKPHRSHIL